MVIFQNKILLITGGTWFVWQCRTAAVSRYRYQRNPHFQSRREETGQYAASISEPENQVLYRRRAEQTFGGRCDDGGGLYLSCRCPEADALRASFPA